MTHGIHNRPYVSDGWREYDNRRRFLRLDKLAMVGAVAWLAGLTAWQYYQAVGCLFQVPWH